MLVVTGSPAFAGDDASLVVLCPRLQHMFEPVPHVVDADGDVVDLAVMEAAFVAIEHLEGLLLRADRREAFFRERERDLLVAAAMHQQERALHLLHDAVEAKAFELLERGGAVRRAARNSRRARAPSRRCAWDRTRACPPGTRRPASRSARSRRSAADCGSARSSRCRARPRSGSRCRAPRDRARRSRIAAPW